MITFSWNALPVSGSLRFLCGCIPEQVVVVDDGGADGTKSVAFDFVKKYSVDNVRVILLGRNHGKGEAIRKVSLI